MEPTRIVLMNMPPLFRDIVRETVLREPGLDVVAELPGDADLRATLAHVHAEFVIIGAHAPDGTAASVVATQRVLRALEVDDDGHSVLHELVPSRIGVEELSPDGLLRMIREAGTEQ
ncbi:MAG TPA: hypothetical protein VG388_03735 [Solirubrobacteraceae bacterium]|nr:hypothetical protein [Solirubrobacteraceae bacterium]